MMDLVSDLRTWTMAQLPSLYATMTKDNWGTTVEALMIRGDPSRARVVEYVDG